jgi:hypothetical protein
MCLVRVPGGHPNEQPGGDPLACLLYSGLLRAHCGQDCAGTWWGKFTLYSCFHYFKSGPLEPERTFMSVANLLN